MVEEEGDENYNVQYTDRNSDVFGVLEEGEGEERRCACTNRKEEWRKETREERGREERLTQPPHPRPHHPQQRTRTAAIPRAPAAAQR